MLRVSTIRWFIATYQKIVWASLVLGLIVLFVECAIMISIDTEFDNLAPWQEPLLDGSLVSVLVMVTCFMAGELSFLPRVGDGSRATSLRLLLKLGVALFLGEVLMHTVARTLQAQLGDGSATAIDTLLLCLYIMPITAWLYWVEDSKHNIHSDKFLRPERVVALAIMAAFGLIGAILLVDLFDCWERHMNQAGSPGMLNTAGRQRMLSQRLARLDLIAQNPSDYSSDLQDDLLEAILTMQKEGDAFFAYTFKKHNPHSELFSALSRADDMRKYLLIQARLSYLGHVPYLRGVIKGSEEHEVLQNLAQRYLISMDEIVLKLQNEMDVEILRNKETDILNNMILFALLFFTYWTVARPIVRILRTFHGAENTARTKEQETLNLMQAIVEHFPGGMAYFDGKRVLRQWNSGFVKMMDIPASIFEKGSPNLEDIIRINALRGEYGAGDVEEQVRERMEMSLKPMAHTFEQVRLDGRVLEIRNMPVASGGLVTTYIDVTEQHRMMSAVVESSQAASSRARELSLTLEHMNQGLNMFDAFERLLTWNDQYLELYNLPPNTLFAGMTFEEIVELQISNHSIADDKDALIYRFREQLQQGEDFQIVTVTHFGRTISSVISPIPGGGWVSTHEDITEREQALARINYAAHHDNLTGLANRVRLKHEIGEAFNAHAYLGKGFGIMLMDLDRFKYVNDTFGHAMGDKLLKEVAERIKSQIAYGDVAARLGGDEFAVLHHLTEGGIAEMRSVAAKLLDEISAPYEIENRQIVIGASIGMAIAPWHGETVDELIRNSDAALYRVKGDGRNAYRMFDDEIHAAACNRRELEKSLREALPLNQFTLAYQPIVNLGTRETCGVETLLRWRHPERGLIFPSIFVPLLEETGLICAVGEWIIQQACQDAVLMPSNVRVAINVSPLQLPDRGLVDVIMSSLANSGLEPGRLEIEVTETVLLSDDKALLSDLHRLRDNGVRIALDDFGTGYSSLGYLRLFPFDKIKIDKSFVDYLGVRQDCSAIIGSILDLAKNLNMISTAEGIESEEQAKLLRLAGCVQGQGYLFSPPKTLKELFPEAADEEKVAWQKLSA